MTEPLSILYSDSRLVAVDKPSGLAVHRGWARGNDFAMTRLRNQLGRWVYPVHRLDQGTSGVLLFALSPTDARCLSERFEAGNVTKRYLALVRGNPPQQCLIDHPLLPDHGTERQPATTSVARLAQYGRYALVQAIPHTGRLHQIRRHLKHISCPLIGDVRYGKGEHNRLFRESYGLFRLALHCAELRLDPELSIQAPLPGDFAGALYKLQSNEGACLSSGNSPSQR